VRQFWFRWGFGPGFGFYARTFWRLPRLKEYMEALEEYRRELQEELRAVEEELELLRRAQQEGEQESH